MKKVTRNLLNKSQEAFLLSLELYNKPTITYRVEGFCFFIINAWELLLKAKIIETTGNEKSIYYKKSRGGERRSLSFDDCTKKVFPSEELPIRKNLNIIFNLRNAATHLIIEETEVLYNGIFQASVLNYVHYLHDWFSLSISDKCSPAMLSLLTDTKSIDIIKLKKKYSPTILEFFEKEKDIISDITSRETNMEFCIPINYKLALVKSTTKADIVLSKGFDGEKEGIIIEVPKDIDKTHPYLFSDIIELVNEESKDKEISMGFNSYDLQSVIYKENIKGNPKYHYSLSKPKADRYSLDLVNLIISKIEKDSKYLLKTRSSYSANLAKLKRLTS